MTARRNILPILGAILSVAAMGGCGQSDRVAEGVPRPKAYPRAALYDTTYIIIDSLPLVVEANSEASVRVTRSDARTIWADVAYPAYRGTLHLTLSRVADADERRHVTDNRTERMALNLGDNTARQMSVESPGGFLTTVLAAESAAVMPVQFLSVGRDWIVSGAFSFADAPASADSIRPVVNAVTADVVNLARNLR